jgi:hypothetical protein
MTVRQSAAARPPNHTAEQRQREHELVEALLAARHLQARLEMLGDRLDDVRATVELRHSLAAQLAGARMDVPGIVLASDDVDEDGAPNEWNAAGLARAAGEVDR